MDTWWGFVFFYGIMTPIGTGINNWTPILCACEWFPDYKGFVSGLMICGFGFSAFAFGPLTTYLVNPDDISPSVPKDGSTED